MEVRPAPAAEESRFEIELGNGRRVRVPPIFDAAAMRSLLAVLTRRRDSAGLTLRPAPYGYVTLGWWERSREIAAPLWFTIRDREETVDVGDR